MDVILYKLYKNINKNMIIIPMVIDNVMYDKYSNYILSYKIMYINLRVSIKTIHSTHLYVYSCIMMTANTYIRYFIDLTILFILKISTIRKTENNI